MEDKPRFQMRMIGEDVAPQTVRASDLADFMSWVETAILSVHPELECGEDADQAIVSLVGIEAGSNKLTFAVTTLALLTVGSISQAVSEAKFNELPRKTHEQLHEISKQAIRKGWIIEFVENKDQNIAKAIISGDNPIPRPTPTVIHGPTTIWGRLMRVGGAKPRAEIRLPDNNLFFFDVTEELAKQLSDGLYETVSVEGSATWEIPSRRLIEFKAARVTNYRPEQTSLASAFENLAELSKGAWDQIDAVKFVDSLRSKD